MGFLVRIFNKCSRMSIRNLTVIRKDTGYWTWWEAVSGNEHCGHWQNEQIQLYLFLCRKCKTRGGSLEMGWWTSYFNCSILYNYQHPIPFVDRYLILLGIQIHFFHDMKFHIRNNGGKLLLYKKKQSICI